MAVQNIETKKKIPIKRNGFYYIKTPEKELKLVSVTEIMKALAKDALRYWTGQQAARIALDDPSLNEKEVIAKVGEISGKAASRGRTIHSLTEAADVEGSLITTEKVMPEIRNYLKAFNQFKRDMQPKLLYNEQIVFSKEENYAGQLDRIYDIDGKIVLADIKTGKAFYQDQAIQTSAYKHANFMYTKQKEVKLLPTIDQMLVILLTEDGTYAVREMPDVYPVFLSLKVVWEFINPEKGALNGS